MGLFTSRHGFASGSVPTALNNAMKAISAEVVLTSASTRSDGSLGLRLATPELKADEKTAFFELLGHPLKMLLQPMEAPDELKDVKKEFQTKTPSQRLRAVMFVWWRQSQEPGEFELFYETKMNAIIETVKSKLNPE